MSCGSDIFWDDHTHSSSTLPYERGVYTAICRTTSNGVNIDIYCLNLLKKTIWKIRFSLRSIRKGSSLGPNPFKGDNIRSESFEGMKGVGDQTTVS